MRSESGTVLVTGGAGYVGSFAAHALTDAGHRVVVLDDMSRGHRAAIHGLEFAEFSLGERDRLVRLLRDRDVRAVVHFAASSLLGESVRDPLTYYRNNVANTLSLLECMHDEGVDRIVFSSTCAVYAPNATMPLDEDSPILPQSPYAFSKLAIEQMIRDCGRAFGLRSTVLRYFNAAGASPDGSRGEDHTPETHLIPLVLQTLLGRQDTLCIYGDDYATPDGTCVRDYVHVQDLARAHVLALEGLGAQPEPSRVFNLGTGTGSSVRQVIHAVERVTGKKVPYRLAARRAGDSPVLVASSERAAVDLGWTPVYTDLDTIIATAWEWHRRHPSGYAPEG